ncbi:hypothetical protein CN383_06435 [Priestia megaterium]|uniref:hypothetical protein n=1 Tax=Priestia megaterium TaxID=1404 RepID=UPI000BF722D0|nr:hypothetical protein [Priestia megaterium]PFB04596.1 hypothetical protein CN383_06435 [Priestia megaterium]
MRRVTGYCTNKIFAIPNIVRGLAGGRESISLPFSVTVTQIIVIFAFFLLSLLLVVPLTPLIPNKIARVIVVCMAAPMFFGYLVGSQTKENMNIIRYWQVKFKTFMEPKELFRFEEVEQAKKITYKRKIPIYRK